MNNPAVFDELYSRYKSSVYSLSCYLTRNQKEAEDLFQETWLRIAKHLAHQTIDMDNCKTWIMTITSNLYRDGLRKSRVRKPFSFQKSNSDRQTDTHLEKPMWGEKSCLENDAKHQEVKMALSTALEGLPPRHRLIFVLKEIEGYKYSEIGEMLSVPEGTVKSIMHRAIKKLRQDLWVYDPKKTIIASV
ncbi:MAG: RNA polymerase sigma factor [Candidatus Aminicenantes bacterium]|nr:RNA polymerase sigma factor [Candidatus Aminicenantes bacterium]